MAMGSPDNRKLTVRFSAAIVRGRFNGDDPNWLGSRL